MTQSNKKLLVGLFCSLISIGLVVFCIMPLWSSIKLLREEHSQQQGERAQVEELIEMTQQLNLEYEQLGENAHRFYLALPQERDIPQLLVQFEHLAVINGLLLESINFQESAQDDAVLGASQRDLSVETPGQSTQGSRSFDEMSIGIEVSGTYEAFKSYLQDLERNLRSMDVASVNFTKSSGSGGIMDLGIFSFQIGVNVYYAKATP